MQRASAEPRTAFSDLQVISHIRDTAGLEVGFGCELTDLTLSNVEDISQDCLSEGSVSRGSYDTIHGSAQLSITRDLPFGYAVLRPYYVMTAGTTTMRFNLGAYFTNTPSRSLQESPVTYSVQCYDVLEGLTNPLGDTYSLSAGTPYLSTVEDIIRGQGFTQYVIDQSAADKVLPAARSWPFTDNSTWLNVINDLLNAVGYQGIWSDWNGALRVQPYASPAVRPIEWIYDTGATTSMLSTDRTEEFDYYKAPNSWVFVRSNNIDGAQPVDGDGIYRYDNVRTGPTSQEARRRTIVKKVPIDAADQASLVAAAQRTIDADMQIPIRVAAATFPNPLHWHFDVLQLDDPDRGVPVRVLDTQWTLPLTGDDMTHQWTVIDV